MGLFTQPDAMYTDGRPRVGGPQSFVNNLYEPQKLALQFNFHAVPTPQTLISHPSLALESLLCFHNDISPFSELPEETMLEGHLISTDDLVGVDVMCNWCYWRGQVRK